jgi:hypothetical protein
MASYLKEFDARRGGDLAHAAAAGLAAAHGPVGHVGGGTSYHPRAIKMAHEGGVVAARNLYNMTRDGPYGGVTGPRPGLYGPGGLPPPRAPSDRPRDTPERVSDRLNVVLGRRAASSTMNKAESNSEVFKRPPLMDAKYGPKRAAPSM